MQPSALVACCIVLTACFLAAEGAQWIELVAENKDKPGQCLDSVTGEYHPLDSSWKRPGVCQGLDCFRAEQPATMSIQGSTCAYPKSVPPRCRLVSDVTLDYPKCCPDLKCDDGVIPNVSWIG